MFNRIHRLRYCCPCLSCGTFLLRNTHYGGRQNKMLEGTLLCRSHRKRPRSAAGNFGPIEQCGGGPPKAIDSGNAQLRGAKIRKHREAPALASVEALLPSLHVARDPCVNLNCITGCGTVV